jgi:hypothetical protein
VEWHETGAAPAYAGLLVFDLETAVCPVFSKPGIEQEPVSPSPVSHEPAAWDMLATPTAGGIFCVKKSGNLKAQC